jgi:hypothetical protein
MGSGLRTHPGHMRTSRSVMKYWQIGVILALTGGSAFAQGWGGVRQEMKLLQKYDKDKDGFLKSDELKVALKDTGYSFPAAGAAAPTTYNPKLSPADVKPYTTEPLYDPRVLRTIFLEFESSDWERQLIWFKYTDIDVPAKATVDGKSYPNVGVRFRGNTSYQMVSEGYKHSFALNFDLADKKQRLYGYRSLHLLNSAQDPTFLRSLLYMQMARDYIPAPLANFVRVVINGETWGIYINVEQFDADLTKRAFGSSEGARWKVPGSPGAGGGLGYLGDNPESYKWAYEIKSKDEPKAWLDLIKLCKTLNQTPSDQLEKTIEPLLDVDGALRFLAMDKALANGDGYWTRASDYSIYEDEKGRFHVLPYDANETFRSSSGTSLDPLAGASDSSKALLYRLLAVPSLRARYMGYLRDIAEKWLNWEKISPLAEKYYALIAEDVMTDQRKLYSNDAFTSGLTQDGGGGGFGFLSVPSISLKSFVEKRRAYLLSYPEIQKTIKP